MPGALLRADFCRISLSLVLEQRFCYLLFVESWSEVFRSEMTTAEVVDAVDFEPEEDDLLDEDVAMEDLDTPPAPAPAPAPKLKSTIITSGTGGSRVGGGAAVAAAAAGRKTKGRGFREEGDADRSQRYAVKEFESLESGGGPGPQRCILLCHFYYLFSSMHCLHIVTFSMIREPW